MPTSYDITSDVEHGLATCGSTFGCAEAIAVSLLALLGWAGFSAGLLYAPRANVRGALTALRVECDRVAAERDALEQFTDRLNDLSTTRLQGSSVQGAGIGVASASSRATSDGMAKVEAAYRETLMAVAHYDEDYDEPFAQHLANEFGEDVAGAVVANERLSPQVKRGLLTATHESRVQREQYIDALERERETLTEANRTLATVIDCCEAVDGDRLRRKPFEELKRRLQRLDTERENLATTLRERQERLHDGVTFGWDRRDAESVYRYLYKDVDATYPVLADGTDLLERMKELETRLTTALTSRL